jgi:hypothetical protein
MHGINFVKMATFAVGWGVVSPNCPVDSPEDESPLVLGAANVLLPDRNT